MPRVSPSTQQTPGKFNVYLPKGKAPQYLAFNTLAEAQAAVKAKKAGVILDPAGKLDPTVQTWSGWDSYQAQFPAAVVLTPGAMPGAAQPALPHRASPIAVSSSSSTPTGAQPSAPTGLPTAGRYNVWLPPYLASRQPGATGPGFINGAYLSFRTAAEAQAEVTRSGRASFWIPRGNPTPSSPGCRRRLRCRTSSTPTCRRSGPRSRCRCGFPPAPEGLTPP